MKSSKTSIKVVSHGAASMYEPQSPLQNVEEKSEEMVIPQEIKENFKIFTEYFDVGYAVSITQKVLSAINKYYFRVEFIGFDEFPERNNPHHPLIFASNHSGMAFPWDAICFASALLERNNFELGKAVRPLTAPALSKAHFMSPFLIPNFWRRLGGIDATRLNFETMMYYQEAHVLIYPEGVPGIGKGFDNRYHLQKLSTSSLRMSIKYKTDIIPFATVNGEFINPLSYSIKSLNKLVQKIGIPFLPIGPMTLLIPLQPWIFYFALPAKLKFVRGRRIKPYEMINKPYEEITEEEFATLRDQIHEQMQRELNYAVERYGKDPYELPELWQMIVQNLGRLFSFFPFMWPILFRAHENEYKRLKKKLFGDKENELSIEEKVRIVKNYHDNEPEKEITFATVIDTLIKNPSILLLYTPIAGLISMFLSKPEE
ncbi:MAG: glycerol acyltransferase [Flammeovirgaceae bacterium]|nr:glycerol acyltransferase [Flammeovirgaceae bacterium]MDW8287715.1 glycerol acyltransferase [Flammeovirgaceae bacterium]